jgi:hypothetical protein
LEAPLADAELNLLINPKEFFQSRVAEALANQNISVPDPVEAYLVNLLCEFINTSNLETPSGVKLSALDTPLALMLKEATEAPPNQRLRILKYLGDSSLYISGFFQDYFKRKTYDVGYFSSVGASAYENVSVLMRDQHGDKHFSTVYRDLAHRFQDLVEVLAEVSELPGENKPVDILAVYDRWTRSPSDRLRRILSRFGIIPISSSNRDDN